MEIPGRAFRPSRRRRIVPAVVAWGLVPVLRGHRRVRIGDDNRKANSNDGNKGPPTRPDPSAWAGPVHHEFSFQEGWVLPTVIAGSQIPGRLAESADQRLSLRRMVSAHCRIVSKLADPMMTHICVLVPSAPRPIGPTFQQSA